MSRDTALAEAKKLKRTMESYGVRCSIELQVGRAYAGDDWFTRKHAIMNHHTAGSRNGLTPSLALCKKGRSNLPGPLCNGYGGRDLIYRILCMGLANHPGAGGPLTMAGFTVPKDSARITVWGTEWEHDGVTAWTPSMQEFMGRANAALIDYLDIPVERSVEHNTWAKGRKIDRNTYTARRGQDEIRYWGRAVELARKPAPKPPAKPAAPPAVAPKEGEMFLIDLTDDAAWFLADGTGCRKIHAPATLTALMKHLRTVRMSTQEMQALDGALRAV